MRKIRKHQRRLGFFSLQHRLGDQYQQQKFIKRFGQFIQCLVAFLWLLFHLCRGIES
jgi:hypothetical protein